jgi:hypothetical protein
MSTQPTRQRLGRPHAALARRGEDQRGVELVPRSNAHPHTLRGQLLCETLKPRRRLGAITELHLRHGHPPPQRRQGAEADRPAAEHPDTQAAAPAQRGTSPRKSGLDHGVDRQGVARRERERAVAARRRSLGGWAGAPPRTPPGPRPAPPRPTPSGCGPLSQGALARQRRWAGRSPGSRRARCARCPRPGDDRLGSAATSGQTPGARS